MRGETRMLYILTTCPLRRSLHSVLHRPLVSSVLICLMGVRFYHFTGCSRCMVTFQMLSFSHNYHLPLPPISTDKSQGCSGWGKMRSSAESVARRSGERKWSVGLEKKGYCFSVENGRCVTTHGMNFGQEIKTLHSIYVKVTNLILHWILKIRLANCK